jgi:hypothetical protein
VRVLVGRCMCCGWEGKGRRDKRAGCIGKEIFLRLEQGRSGKGK